MEKIISYAKKNLLGIFVAFGVVAFLYEGLYKTDFNFRLTKIAFILIGFAALYEKYHDRLDLRKKLAKKGLITADLNNIVFVRNWEILRKKGVRKYCLYDGGVVMGAILFFPVSLVIFLITGYSLKIFPSFSQIAFFISICVGISFLFGILISRINWILNEKRYTRLTDPVK